MTDDSARVEAIHYWIGRHIAYDVKKAGKYNFSRQSVKNVLLRRKAVCVGYADLFKELCLYSDIKAIQIPGYSKNIDVDIVDTFYLDDHIWNAALINGHWRLIDPTWDAGVVVFYKKHMGRKLKARFKPHFKRATSNRYFMIAPELFILDHLPANPRWQILDNTISIESFARDSSFYFKSKGIDSLYSDQGKDASYGLRYLEMTDDERRVEDGAQSYAYNRRHHEYIADAWRIRAEEVAKGMKKKTTDTVEELLICDTTLMMLDKAINHYDRNTTMLQLERAQRSAFNDLKKELFNAYIPPMISSARRNFIKIRSGIAFCKKIAASCKAAVKINNRRTQSINMDVSFEKVKPARKTLIADSVAIEKVMAEKRDTLRKFQAILAKDSADMEAINRMVKANADRYTTEERLTLIDLIDDIDTRMDFFDDLDNEIKTGAPKLVQQKQKADSNLFIGNKFFIDTIRASVWKYRTDLRNIYVGYRAVATQIKRLRSACQDRNHLQELYKANSDTMLAYLTLTDGIFEKWQSRASGIRGYCKLQWRKTKREWNDLIFDRLVEKLNSRMRNRQISRKAVALIRFGNAHKLQALRLRSKVENHRRRFAKPIV